MPLGERHEAVRRLRRVKSESSGDDKHTEEERNNTARKKVAVILGAGGEVCISWLELQGSTDRDRGSAMAYFRTNTAPLGLSFALEFLPTFWREGEANVGGDKV